MLRNLDESGIIRIGANVKADDILVGKITPKGETQLTPEEKLLRAIFGDKARDVKNTSLKVPPGIEGTVIDVKVFNRRSGEKDERAKAIEEYDLATLDRRESQHVASLTWTVRDKVWDVVQGKQLGAGIMGRKKGEVLAEEGHTLDRDVLDQLALKKLAGVFRNKEVNDEVQDLLEAYDRQVKCVKSIYEQKRAKVSEGDDLPPGVIKMVKVFLAVKRKLSVGDKMAGRHGNKGVVSCILPMEDMPFFADGTPRRHRTQPPGRAFTYEHRADHGDAPWLGRQGVGGDHELDADARRGHGRVAPGGQGCLRLPGDRRAGGLHGRRGLYGRGAEYTQRHRHQEPGLRRSLGKSDLGMAGQGQAA